MGGRNAKDLKGRKFGQLKVLERVGSSKDGAALWKCVCSCGGIKIVRSYSLIRGNTKSCGCLRFSPFNKGRVKKKYASKKEAAWRFFYNQYKRNAKHRGIKVSITYKEFVSICERPCHYCGKQPEKRPVQKGRASINASGVDRLENDNGYTLGNSVPCCTWCNRAKSSHTAEYFIKSCIRVANAAVARREVGAGPEKQ